MRALLTPELENSSLTELLRLLANPLTALFIVPETWFMMPLVNVFICWPIEDLFNIPPMRLQTWPPPQRDETAPPTFPVNPCVSAAHVSLPLP